MNEQVMILLALGVICASSAAFALILPALAGAAGRGSLRMVARVCAVMAVLVVITVAVAAALGSSTAAYSLVS